MYRLAIVVPCYKEEEVLEICSAALREVLNDLVSKGKIKDDSYILFVNDGSTDRTWELIEREHSKYPNQVKGVNLAGNVGHQYALTAGLLVAKNMCDISVSIDADLQDDVTVIEKMVDEYYAGNDIVYGVRNDRSTDTFFKRATAQGFYKFMEVMGVKTVYNHADFRLMSQRAVEHFSKFKESNLFLRGMMPLIGYKTSSVYYSRKERVAGESKYPLKPISLIVTAGFVIIALSILAAAYSLVMYFVGNTQPGWTSLMLSIWFLGGLQLFAIGLVGMYIGKIYMEVKERPRYNIEKILD